MLAQQPDPLRRLSQIQHRISEVLAVARADPHRVELEFGERGVDVHRREVAGVGEFDAVVANPVQQPYVRPHRRGGRVGADQHFEKAYPPPRPCSYTVIMGRAL